MSAELHPSDTSGEAGRERPGGPGARLHAAREARGLSLAAAGEQLKLKQGIIAALEADEYHKLPSILFARGYLRSYARLLELPVAEVIGAFEALGLSEAPPAVPKGAILTSKRRGENLMLKWGSVLVLVVLGALLFAWFQGRPAPALLTRLGDHDASTGEETSAPLRETLPEPAPADRSEAVVAPLPTPLPAPLPEATPPVPDLPPERPQTETEDASGAPDGDVVPPPAPAGAVQADTGNPPLTVVPPVTAMPDTAPPAAPDESGAVDRLVLETSEDSWAEVTDSRGERLVYQLLKAGTVLEVGGRGPLRVFLGNAPGVELRFNGEVVTPVRANSRGVARLTLGAPAPGDR